jgi:hypothetical protein
MPHKALPILLKAPIQGLSQNWKILDYPMESARADDYRDARLSRCAADRASAAEPGY